MDKLIILGTLLVIFVPVPLTHGYSGSQCTLDSGRCVYHVNLSQRDCASGDKAVADQMQLDHSARIHDLEKSFAEVRLTYSQKIASLENSLLALTGERYVYRGHNAEERRFAELSAPHRDPKNLVNVGLSEVTYEHNLLSQIQKEFGVLRRDLTMTRQRLHDTESHLRKTKDTLNKTESELFQTVKKLLDTEETLLEVTNRNAMLQQNLFSTSQKLNETFRSLEDTKTKLKTSEKALLLEQKEKARLQNELSECQGHLKVTQRSLEESSRQHQQLLVQHQNTTKELERKQRLLIECHTAKTSSFCDFEGGSNICGFRQENNTDFLDWTLWSKVTPSAMTGPHTDHTCGNDQGHYMYVEATARERGQNARLVSPMYYGETEQCVEFWYHMYGYHVGTLNVYTMASGVEEDTPKWRAYGNQGDVWTSAKLSVPKESTIRGYEIAFEVILERGYQGDIAIDDFRVFDGPCFTRTNIAETPPVVDQLKLKIPRPKRHHRSRKTRRKL